MKSQISKNLTLRKTAKEFDLKAPRISDEELNEITEAIRMSPMSMGLLGQRIIVIKNGKLKDELSKKANTQLNFKTSDIHIIFVSSKLTHLKNVVIDRTFRDFKSVEEINNRINYITKHINSIDEEFAIQWQKKQSYIQLGIATVVASELGIDTVCQEGFDSIETERILIENNLLSENEQVSVMMGFGKNGKSLPFPKNRLSKEEFIKIVD